VSWGADPEGQHFQLPLKVESEIVQLFQDHPHMNSNRVLPTAQERKLGLKEPTRSEDRTTMTIAYEAKIRCPNDGTLC